MIVYHETNPGMLESILAEGLRRTTHGEKGSDAAIIKTDHLLDANLPEELRRCGVGRDNSVYGYLTVGHNVIDIQDGALIPLSRKARDPHYVLLQMDVMPERCYVSNLDLYDTIKSAVDQNEAPHALDEIALLYWDSLVRLDSYEPGQIIRPEVMIAYDVQPECIKSVSTHG